MTNGISSHVIYIDDTRVEHHALVENAFGGTLDDKPAINLLYINVPKGADQYGAQKEHATSVVHISNNSAKANCWKFANE